MEGKSVFGQVLERHGNSYSFRYADEKGKIRTGKARRSDIKGRLGDHLIPDLESLVAPAKRRRTAGPKAKTRNVVSPGDWHRFQYEGSTVPGVVYRVEGDDYVMFFLYKGVPTFVTLPVGKLGTREESLTAAFREQTARNPEYLEEWVAAAGRPGRPAPPSPEPARRMPRPARHRPPGKEEVVERPATVVPRVKVAGVQVSAVPGRSIRAIAGRIPLRKNSAILSYGATIPPLPRNFLPIDRLFPGLETPPTLHILRPR